MNKRHSWTGGSIAVLALLAGSPGAVQADTVRCGRKLAVEGDSLYDVRSRCGEPDNQIHRVELRTVREWVQRACSEPDQQHCGSMVERTVEVVIDEWTYDFGPTQFIQYLFFEQGRLVRVVPGDRGTKKKNAS